MRRIGRALLLGLLGLSLPLGPADAGPGKEKKGEKKKPKHALDFQVKDIDGKPVDLKKYLGKVVLVVNVASL